MEERLRRKAVKNGQYKILQYFMPVKYLLLIVKASYIRLGLRSHPYFFIGIHGQNDSTFCLPDAPLKLKHTRE